MSTSAIDLRSEQDEVTPQSPPLRFVTAASLFDGHDAAINMMRRLIQAAGAEVIHLGHNRSVADVVRAAIQEDADGIAVSSYQGGHLEYFKYMVDMLREQGAGHIRVFGGGGGTITASEAAELEAYGVERIYLPGDGQQLGLEGMIADLIERTSRVQELSALPAETAPSSDLTIARTLSALEDEVVPEATRDQLRAEWIAAGAAVPVVGITGTGGAGKSTVTDELVSRFLQYFPDARIAVLAVDPTRRRTGGALLGDRIRMNSLRDGRVFMRSLATRRRNAATSAVLEDAVALMRAQGFDLVIVETAGIGQSDSAIVDLVDVSLYVMTAEYGAASQLEKIDMLDLAGILVLNKFDKRGSQDALRDVRKQWRRNHLAFTASDDEVPVFPTTASQFDDPGVTLLFAALCRALTDSGLEGGAQFVPELPVADRDLPTRGALIPPERTGYLGEIAQQGREIGERIERSAATADTARHCYEALKARRRSAAARALRALSGRGPGARRPRAVPGRLQRGARGARQRGRRGAQEAPGSGSRGSPRRRTPTTCAAGRSPATTTATR